MSTACVMPEDIAHDFMAFQPKGGGQPLMYCAKCGEVRKLELRRITITTGDQDITVDGTVRYPDTSQVTYTDAPA